MVERGLVCRHAPGLLLCHRGSHALETTSLWVTALETGGRKMMVVSAGPVAPKGDFGLSPGWEVHPLHFESPAWAPVCESRSHDFLYDSGSCLLHPCLGVGGLQVQTLLSSGRCGTAALFAHLHLLLAPPSWEALGCCGLGLCSAEALCRAGVGTPGDVWTPLAELPISVFTGECTQCQPCHAPLCYESCSHAVFLGSMWGDLCVVPAT